MARQLLLFGRLIPIEELSAKIEAIEAGAVRKLAGRILSGSTPTLATVGPVKGMLDRSRIAERFGATVGA
jgi:predicted Zn-dependent peptidase